MRKITEQAVQAFRNNERLSKDNTLVDNITGDMVRLWLHGNLIATKDLKTEVVKVSNSGWETTTTKERLNGLLNSLGISGIYQKNFVWYWKDGEEFPFNTFVKV